MIAGLCESPLTFQAITVWRDELLDEAIMLRDVIDLETTFSGADGADEVESVLSGLKTGVAPARPRAEARAGAARRRRAPRARPPRRSHRPTTRTTRTTTPLADEEEEEAPPRPTPTRRRTTTRATCRSPRWKRR